MRKGAARKRARRAHGGSRRGQRRRCAGFLGLAFLALAALFFAADFFAPVERIAAFLAAVFLGDAFFARAFLAAAFGGAIFFAGAFFAAAFFAGPVDLAAGFAELFFAPLETGLAFAAEALVFAAGGLGRGLRAAGVGGCAIFAARDCARTGALSPTASSAAGCGASTMDDPAGVPSVAGASGTVCVSIAALRLAGLRGVCSFDGWCSARTRGCAA